MLLGDVEAFVFGIFDKDTDALRPISENLLSSTRAIGLTAAGTTVGHHQGIGLAGKGAA
jgi:hypothetical protein